jgi:hypothetical protein
MKALVDGFASRAFNKKVADDREAQRLTMDMLQAFYRREHETVISLSDRGARFTTEMLQVAVGFRDPNLTNICLEGGVLPNEAMVKFAIDCRDAPLSEMLMKKIPAASEDLKRYAAQKASLPGASPEIIDTHRA